MELRKLRPTETVGLNLDRLEGFWRQVGSDRGELALSAAMEDVALMLRDIAAAWTASDLPILRMRALGLLGMADRLGLPLLAQVAGDVIALCGTRDGAALSATVARLDRVGERSLIAIWDAQMPGR